MKTLNVRVAFSNPTYATKARIGPTVPAKAFLQPPITATICMLPVGDPTHLICTTLFADTEPVHKYTGWVGQFHGWRGAKCGDNKLVWHSCHSWTVLSMSPSIQDHHKKKKNIFFNALYLCHAWVRFMQLLENSLTVSRRDYHMRFLENTLNLQREFSSLQREREQLCSTSVVGSPTSTDIL